MRRRAFAAAFASAAAATCGGGAPALLLLGDSRDRLAYRDYVVPDACRPSTRDTASHCLHRSAR